MGEVFLIVAMVCIPFVCLSYVCADVNRAPYKCTRCGNRRAYRKGFDWCNKCIHEYGD